MTELAPPTPVFGRRSEAVRASLQDLDGRQVSWFSLDGGKHRGAIGTPEGQTIERAVHLAVELGIPVVGRVASSGADVNEGVAALHAWGRVAKALSDASGVVPIVLLLDGPAVSGPALLLGIADQVIMTGQLVCVRDRPRRGRGLHRRRHRPGSPRRECGARAHERCRDHGGARRERSDGRRHRAAVVPAREPPRGPSLRVV